MACCSHPPFFFAYFFFALQLALAPALGSVYYCRLRHLPAQASRTPALSLCSPIRAAPPSSAFLRLSNLPVSLSLTPSGAWLVRKPAHQRRDDKNLAQQTQRRLSLAVGASRLPSFCCVVVVFCICFLEIVSYSQANLLPNQIFFWFFSFLSKLLQLLKQVQVFLFFVCEFYWSFIFLFDLISLFKESNSVAF